MPAEFLVRRRGRKADLLTHKRFPAPAPPPRPRRSGRVRLQASTEPPATIEYAMSNYCGRRRGQTQTRASGHQTTV
ncbi:hypothetical protein EVAR_80390_1 [Eumeta japonica]|uniref:Uncharacterized protein n=1 Tax=Eumeta variegata TaxID=151549 RepID=A0A4C1VHQ3_EUMVA|nr:hypothetical protein EVAR_80390_1 [Eumeta japonica]